MSRANQSIINLTVVSRQEQSTTDFYTVAGDYSYRHHNATCPLDVKFKRGDCHLNSAPFSVLMIKMRERVPFKEGQPIVLLFPSPEHR